MEPGPPPQLYQPEFQRELVKKLQQQASIDPKPNNSTQYLQLSSASPSQPQLTENHSTGGGTLQQQQVVLPAGGQGLQMQSTPGVNPGTPLQSGSQMNTPPAPAPLSATMPSFVNNPTAIDQSTIIYQQNVGPIDLSHQQQLSGYQPAQQQLNTAQVIQDVGQQITATGMLSQPSNMAGVPQNLFQTTSSLQQEYVQYHDPGNQQPGLHSSSLPGAAGNLMSSTMHGVVSGGASVVSSPGQFPGVIQEEMTAAVQQVDSRPGSVLDHHHLDLDIAGSAISAIPAQPGGSNIAPATGGSSYAPSPGISVGQSSTSNIQVSCVTGNVVQVTCGSIPLISYPPKLDIGVASTYNNSMVGVSLSSSGAVQYPGVHPPGAMLTGQPGGAHNHHSNNCTYKYPNSAPILLHHQQHPAHHNPKQGYDKDYRRGSLPVSVAHSHHHHNVFLYPTNDLASLATSLESLASASSASQTGNRTTLDTVSSPVLPALPKFPGRLGSGFPHQSTRRRSADPSEIYRARQSMRQASARSGSASPNRTSGGTASLLYQQDFGDSSEELISYLEKRRASAGNVTGLLSPVLESMLPGLRDLAHLHSSKSMSTIREMGSQSSLQVCHDTYYSACTMPAPERSPPCSL